MAERKSIGKKTRFEVFKRDGFTCQYCGSAPPKVILHVDHIVAVAEGGTNDQDNLVTSCDACNLGKGARPLEVAPMPLKEKAALVAEAEEQLRGYHEVIQSKRKRIEDETWQVATGFMDHHRLESITKDEFQSIKQFIEKLGYHEVDEAMEIAVARKPWSRWTSFKYFCGICWNKVKANGPR
jgi:hypothetical protein